MDPEDFSVQGLAGLQHVTKNSHYALLYIFLPKLGAVSNEYGEPSYDITRMRKYIVANGIRKYWQISVGQCEASEKQMKNMKGKLHS